MDGAGYAQAAKTVSYALPQPSNKLVWGTKGARQADWTLRLDAFSTVDRASGHGKIKVTSEDHVNWVFVLHVIVVITYNPPGVILVSERFTSAVPVFKFVD